MDTDARRRKRGQAVIEFCVGLIALLTVVAGVFQLGRLGLARTEARVEATRIATARSMRSLDETGLSLPSYVGHMSEGADTFTYSEDDVRVGGDDHAVYEQLLDPHLPHVLQSYAPDNPLADIDDSFEMMLNMGLVPGTGMSLNVPVMPIVRRLFFDRDEVDIQVTTWSVRTGDIY